MDWKNHLLDEFEGIERMTLLLPSMYSDDWKTEDLYYDAVYDTFYILSASQAGEVVRSVSESFIRLLNLPEDIWEEVSTLRKAHKTAPDDTTQSF